MPSCVSDSVLDLDVSNAAGGGEASDAGARSDNRQPPDAVAPSLKPRKTDANQSKALFEERGNAVPVALETIGSDNRVVTTPVESATPTESTKPVESTTPSEIDVTVPTERTPPVRVTTPADETPAEACSSAVSVGTLGKGSTPLPLTGSDSPSPSEVRDSGQPDPAVPIRGANTGTTAGPGRLNSASNDSTSSVTMVTKAVGNSKPDRGKFDETLSAEDNETVTRDTDWEDLWRISAKDFVDSDSVTESDGESSRKTFTVTSTFRSRNGCKNTTLPVKTTQLDGVDKTDMSGPDDGQNSGADWVEENPNGLKPVPAEAEPRTRKGPEGHEVEERALSGDCANGEDAPEMCSGGTEPESLRVGEAVENAPAVDEEEDDDEDVVDPGETRKCSNEETEPVRMHEVLVCLTERKALPVRMDCVDRTLTGMPGPKYMLKEQPFKVSQLPLPELRTEDQAQEISDQTSGTTSQACEYLDRTPVGTNRSNFKLTFLDLEIPDPPWPGSRFAVTGPDSRALEPASDPYSLVDAEGRVLRPVWTNEDRDGGDEDYNEARNNLDPGLDPGDQRGSGMDQSGFRSPGLRDILDCADGIRNPDTDPDSCAAEIDVPDCWGMDDALFDTGDTRLEWSESEGGPTLDPNLDVGVFARAEDQLVSQINHTGSAPEGRLESEQGGRSENQKFGAESVPERTTGNPRFASALMESSENVTKPTIANAPEHNTRNTDTGTEDQGQKDVIGSDAAQSQSEKQRRDAHAQGATGTGSKPAGKVSLRGAHCDLCGRNFIKSECFRRHVTEHDKLNFRCVTGCSCLFRNFCKLKLHALANHGVRLTNDEKSQYEIHQGSPQSAGDVTSQSVKQEHRHRGSDGKFMRRPLPWGKPAKQEHQHRGSDGKFMRSPLPWGQPATEQQLQYSSVPIASAANAPDTTVGKQAPPVGGPRGPGSAEPGHGGPGPAAREPDPASEEPDLASEGQGPVVGPGPTAGEPGAASGEPELTPPDGGPPAAPEAVPGSAMRCSLCWRLFQKRENLEKHKAEHEDGSLR